MWFFPFALATVYTKTTTTTTIELIRAPDNKIDDQEDSDNEDILAIVAALVAGDYRGRYCIKIPCRTSSLGGEARIQELLSQAHPRRFQEVLRMPFDTFKELASFCRSYTSLRSSRHISVEQKLAMFLLCVGEGVSNRAVQEQYQHSGETVSRLESL